MTVKDAILAAVAGDRGEVRGRTVLQKKLYFSSVLVREDFGFSPHYYGPYSATVADELDALVEAGLVDESVEVLSEDQRTPFGERRRYVYNLNASSDQVLEKRSQAAGAYVAALGQINSHPVGQNPKLLPIAAKVHFIVARHGRATVGEITQRAGELGWELSDGDIKQVIGFLEHLGLVATA